MKLTSYVRLRFSIKDKLKYCYRDSRSENCRTSLILRATPMTSFTPDIMIRSSALWTFSLMENALAGLRNELKNGRTRQKVPIPDSWCFGALHFIVTVSEKVGGTHGQIHWIFETRCCSRKKRIDCLTGNEIVHKNCVTWIKETFIVLFNSILNKIID